jgi:hypothetical protein
MSESFLSRWSRRKRAEPGQVQAEDERLAREQAPPMPAQVTAESAPPVPLPDLPPIESLTPQADFTPFMQPEVPVQMKNAALKKLFTDPHFNMMDGLDTYIDDYTKPDPIPEAMLRSLVQSKTLKLFEEIEEEKTAEVPAGAVDLVPPVQALALEEPGTGGQTLAPDMFAPDESESRPDPDGALR